MTPATAIVACLMEPLQHLLSTYIYSPSYAISHCINSAHSSLQTAAARPALLIYEADYWLSFLAFQCYKHHRNSRPLTSSTEEVEKKNREVSQIKCALIFIHHLFILLCFQLGTIVVWPRGSTFCIINDKFWIKI